MADLLLAGFLPPFLLPVLLFFEGLALALEACWGEADDAFLMFFEPALLAPPAGFLEPPTFFDDLFVTCPFAIT